MRRPGGKAFLLVLEEAATVPGQDEDTPHPGPGASLDVDPAVADDIGGPRIDVELLHRALDQPRNRLTATTFLTVRRCAFVRMMGAVVDPVDLGAALAQQPDQFLVDFENERFREVTARHSGLVRHHHS